MHQRKRQYLIRVAVAVWIGLAHWSWLDAAELRLSAPLDYQIYQRDTVDKGWIAIEGELPAVMTDPVTVEVLLGGTAANVSWRRVGEVDPGKATFRMELEAPAGGWYRLDVRILRGETILSSRTVTHVGVGEIFVVAGQSNSANHGEQKQKAASELVVAFSGNHWQPAHDPQPGATGSGGSFLPSFGDEIANRFKVPVGLIAVGVGATSVREWLPARARFARPPTLTGNVIQLGNGEWESKGELFSRFTTRLRQLGLRGFRAVLWHQGESDANQRDPSRTLPGELYQQFMGQLIGQSRQTAGWDFPWFVAQASYHTPDDPGSPDIRAAQAALWRSGIALEGPDSDALTGDLRDGGGTGVHFSGKGLRIHGAKWAEKVSPWLEAQLTAKSRRLQ